mmetsp:Transcript_58814/g.191849  ORF Transcript_58814/g.191849 Transcript_58814/m.191849 type:complete len:625 (+) Transcript_58814:330-2204(+)
MLSRPVHAGPHELLDGSPAAGPAARISAARGRAAAGVRAAPAARRRAAIFATTTATTTTTIVTKLLLDHLVHETLGGHPAMRSNLRARIVAEDDEALLATLVKRHEHVGLSLFLHATQFAATVAGHPALAILGDVHLRRVVARPEVGDRHAAAALSQEPRHVLAGTLAFLARASDERNVSNVLQDGTSRSFEFFARGALLAQGIAQLVVLEDDAVCVEPLLRARLLADAAREGARALGLDAGHDLQFCSTPVALRPEDDQFFGLASPASSITLPVHEEHEHTPLFLHGAQSSTASSRDVADAIAGHVHHCAIVAILPAIDVDRTLELLEEPLHVLACLLPLRARAREQRCVAHVLHHGLGRSLQLLARSPLLAQRVGELVVLERHGVGAPGLGLVLAFVATQHILPDLLEVARDLRLHGTEHEQLCATSATDTAEDCELLVVLVPATASADVAEKHQGAPLLLDGAQEVARAAGHEANGLLGNLQHCKVAVVVVAGDRDGPRALGHDALGVLLGLPPLELGAPDLEDQVALEELDLCLSYAGDLFFGFATLAQNERSVIVGDLHGIHAIVVGLTLLAPTGAPTPAVLAAALASALVPAPALLVPALAAAAGALAPPHGRQLLLP